MKVIGIKEKDMDKEFIDGQMVKAITGNGNMIKWMERALLKRLTEQYMMETFKMIPF